MPKPGPRTTKRYSDFFKATAVRLSQLPGVKVNDVAASLSIHPFMLSRWRKLAREGLILAEPGKRIDWDLAEGCHPDLDKLLWVVAKRTAGRWQAKHLFICASEPPNWYLEQFDGFVWPCGVYKGLNDGGGRDLEAQCRQSRRKYPHQ